MPREGEVRVGHSYTIAFEESLEHVKLHFAESHEQHEGVSQSAALFEKYGSFIRAVIRSKTSDRTLAEDMYQDFFLTLAAKPIPRNVRDIKAYLYRMIVNDVLDASRRMNNYKGAVQRCVENSPVLINNEASENAFIEREETEKVFRVIAGLLPYCEAQAITLRYKCNYSTNEIARKMGIKSRSVSRYICVGLGKLRHLLKVEGLR